MKKKFKILLIDCDISEIYYSSVTKSLGYTLGFSPKGEIRNKPKQLIIINDDKIKDWVYSDGVIGKYFNVDNKFIYLKSSDGNTISRLPETCKKLIASSNELLLRIDNNLGQSRPKFAYLPLIPKSFIEYYIKEYNKGNQIKFVDIIYERNAVHCLVDESPEYLLKTNQQNEISIVISEENIDKIIESYGYHNVDKTGTDGQKAFFQGAKDMYIKLKSEEKKYSKEEVIELINTKLIEFDTPAGFKAVFKSNLLELFK